MTSFRFLLLTAAAVLCGFTAPQLNGADYGPINILPLQSSGVGGGYTSHGYYEVQLRITNRNTRAHRVELSNELPSHNRYSTHLRQTKTRVEVPAETSVLVRLLQPPVSMSGGGECFVSIDGFRQKNSVSPVFDGSHAAHPYYVKNQAVIFVSQGVPADTRDLIQKEYKPPPAEAPPWTEAGQEGATETAAPTPVYSGITGRPEREVFSRLSSVPVSEWSDSFLFYTRFDCVALTAKEYSELETGKPAVLSAIRKYTELGGLLCIVVDDENNHNWKAPQEWTVETYNHNGNMYRAGFGDIYILGTLKGNESRINPFRETVLKKREDLSARISEQTLLSSLPVIAHYGIPTKLILVLIFLFAFIIGPLNVFVLHYWKRRIWLLWTVPLLSFIACVTVLGASLVQEGLLFQSSSVSFTVLNQRSGEALTTGYAGYYSTFTPEALAFSMDTEVSLCDKSLQTSYSDNPLSLRYELRSGNQLFTNGWIQARIPAYFYLRKARSQRKERLNFDFSGDEATAVNGFGADIRRLTVRSPEGQLYEAEHLRAGQKVTLKKLGSSPHKPSVSETTGKRLEAYQRLSRTATPTVYSPDYLSAGSYFAEMDSWNPFLEPGLEKLKPFKNSTVVLGKF